MNPATNVEIRCAISLEDYQACVDLQRGIWGFTSECDLVHLPTLKTQNRYGGRLLIATDDNGRYVGFSFAVLGKQEGRFFWWSHMTGVVEDYRKRGLGFQLKLRQREEAISAGIDEIRWTFDPLKTLNANFNFRKLGVIANQYEEGFYGHWVSPLSRLPTDRFIAVWSLNSARVVGRITNRSPAPCAPPRRAVPLHSVAASKSYEPNYG